MSTTWTAMVGNRLGRFRYEVRHAPPCAAGEVRIRMRAVGICGTDLDIARGNRADAAQVLGHEGSGVISAHGPDVLDWRIGEVVAFNPVDPTDQERVLGHSYDGLLQEEVRLLEPQVPARLLVKVPATVPYWAAALVEPLSVVLYAREILERYVAVGEVVLIGSGGFAHVAARYWSNAGRRVAIVSRNTARHAALAAQSGEGLEYLSAEQLMSRPRAECVIVCSSRESASWAYDLAVRACAAGGIIDFVSGSTQAISVYDGAMKREMRIDDVRRLNACGAAHIAVEHRFEGRTLRVSGHRGSTARHYRRALELLGERAASYRGCFGMCVPFQELAGFLNGDCSRPLGQRGKILVEFPASSEPQ